MHDSRAISPATRHHRGCSAVDEPGNDVTTHHMHRAAGWRTVVHTRSPPPHPQDVCHPPAVAFRLSFIDHSIMASFNSHLDFINKPKTTTFTGREKSEEGQIHCLVPCSKGQTQGGAVWAGEARKSQERQDSPARPFKYQPR